MGKDLLPVGLSSKRCVPWVRKIPLCLLEQLRCEAAPNRAGTTCGCGRIAHKSSTPVLGHATSSKECLG